MLNVAAVMYNISHAETLRKETSQKHALLSIYRKQGFLGNQSTDQAVKPVGNWYASESSHSTWPSGIIQRILMSPVLPFNRQGFLINVHPRPKINLPFIYEYSKTLITSHVTKESPQ